MTNSHRPWIMLIVGSGLVAPACYPPRPRENQTISGGNHPSAAGGGPSTDDGGGSGNGDDLGGAAHDTDSINDTDSVGETSSTGDTSSVGETGSTGDTGTSDVIHEPPIVIPEDRCPEGPTNNLPFSKQNLLASVGQCAARRYCEFQVAAEILSDSSSDYAQSLDVEDRSEVRAAYSQAMTAWARAELFQFGPAASKSKDMITGQGFRDLIYSWPFVSRCRVEEQILGRAYQSHGFDNLVQVPINARGLFAVEYLAHYEGTDNACTQFSITNSGAAWANTSAQDLLELKAAYLEAVSADVLERATQLFEAWEPSGGDYLDQLEHAEGYMDQQQALNIVAQALLYIEVEVKDYKVGAPAGLYENAPLERPESSFSGKATTLLAYNLQGFEDVFVGCDGEGLGFDDWLIEAGHPDLATDIAQALIGAKLAVGSFPELSQASNAELVQLHTSIKALTNFLKADLFGQGSPLGLILPASVEGDAD